MGKALYRKYRSKTLDDVVGQEHITTTLKNALKKNAISHAYLFTGPRGVGKTSVARILAHEINDLPYNEETTHLDIIEIDAASNRRIDEIRDLRDKVHIAPTSAKYKVYIIDEVHMLTREAFNALLKTLEEPPEHVVFILATTEAHKVPETIISRTQQYSFKPIDTEHAVMHLRSISDQENLEITDKALLLIAQHGKGSFRDSISMLDQLTGLEGEIDEERVANLLGVPNDDVLNALLQAVADADGDALFSASQQLREKGASSTNTAQRLIELLKNQIITQTTVLPLADTVSLMKGLLPATGSQSSIEQIEIALLDAMPLERSNNERNIEHITTENKPPKRNSENTKKQNISLPPTEPIEEVQETITGAATKTDWDSVLQALKTKHNTLYGILRMADAELDGDVIRLTFAFEFHKKQLKQNKNLDILHGVIFDTYGRKHELELIVKKQNKKSPVINSTDSNDVVSSVSNIFGGAELLES